jgi:N-acetylneuraminic acid mutarotase
VYVYDPQTDSWTRKADMPTARFGFQTYLVGGKIYAVGGTSMMSDALKSVEEYDPVANTWRTLGDMPVPLAWFGGAVANNKIYVISGTPDGGYTGTGDIWEYDPAMTSGGWTKKATLPTLRGALGACVIGQKLFTVGGVTKSPFTDLAANEVYDLNPWAVKAPIPTKRGWLSVAVVNDTMYAIGGGYPDATKKVEAYNPATNTWMPKADMLSPRRAAQAGVVNGIIYNIGGNTDQRSCEAYDPVQDKWTAKEPMPGAGGDVAVTVYNGLVYTFGGGLDNTAYANVYAFDPQTNAWSQKRDMPTPRYAFQTYLVRGKIYAIGGNQSRSTALKTVEVYDPVADTWKTLEDMPERLAWFGGAVANDKIYLISGTPDYGQSGTGDIWEYTPPLSTAVGDAASYELPNQYVLEQNYPNPFNPTTVVRYQLPLAGEVTLAVYDLLGREVALLVNGRVDAGVHEVTFDGSGLSSGMYLCRLSAGGVVQSRRLLLLK